MKPLRLVFAVALLLTLVPVLASAAETEKVHKAVPLAPGGTVVLHNFSGAVRIVGADVSEVTIDAVRTAARDRLDHIKLDVQVNGSTVTIEANKKDEGWTVKNDNVVQTEFDIQVPKNTRLELDVFSSDIHVRNVAGEQSIKAFSGDVTVEGGSARMAAKTFSGGDHPGAGGVGDGARPRPRDVLGCDRPAGAGGGKGRADVRLLQRAADERSAAHHWRTEEGPPQGRAQRRRRAAPGAPQDVLGQREDRHLGTEGRWPRLRVRRRTHAASQGSARSNAVLGAPRRLPPWGALRSGRPETRRAWPALGIAAPRSVRHGPSTPSVSRT